jgi:putative membrane protein
LTGALALGACSKQGQAKQNTGFGDQQIAAVLSSLDQSEIRESQIAQQKALDPAVKSFADQMVSEHSSSKDQFSRMFQRLNVQPIANNVSEDLVSDSRKAIDNLQSKSGHDFDKEFVDREVKDHQDALDTIDNKLLPNAQNPELKTQIQNVLRPKIEAHLRMAQQVQKDISNKKDSDYDMHKGMNPSVGSPGSPMTGDAGYYPGTQPPSGYGAPGTGTQPGTGTGTGTRSGSDMGTGTGTGTGRPGTGTHTGSQGGTPRNP